MAFLIDSQKKTLDRYDSLESKEKAEFTFRLVRKIKRALDDIGEINNLIDRLPPGALDRAVSDNHLPELYKLTERVMESLDVVPVGTDVNGLKFVAKSLAITPRKPGGEVELYQKVRRANDTDIKRMEDLENHIKTLEAFTSTDAQIPDPRSDRYYQDMIEAVGKKGYDLLRRAHMIEINIEPKEETSE